MPQTNLVKAAKRASRLGVTIKPSTRKYKKLNVFEKGKKIVSIGDIRYQNFLTHQDPRRRRLYKQRHEKTRKKRGSASFYADQILW